SHIVIYTLSLHDALPISSLTAFFIASLRMAKASSSSLSVFVLKEVLDSPEVVEFKGSGPTPRTPLSTGGTGGTSVGAWGALPARSEEHTSELQSQSNLVC